MKIYNPAVHPREPFANGRNVRRSPFWEREKELGGYFMELGGWERAHGYAANEHLLEKYGNRVPVRENEWDNRHFWRVSNAEHLAMSEDCGIINLSHFAMYDVEGPDHVALMEWLCAAKIGGDANIGKGIYTHFLDDEGMVRADLTVIRMADRCRVIDGADAGPRDFNYMQARGRGQRLRRHRHRRDREIRHHRHLGPERARPRCRRWSRTRTGSMPENFPFAAIKPIRIAGKDVTAFRISYVGEQGWELHMRYEDGLAVWDALRSTGVIAGRRRDLRQLAPHGKEPAPAERRPPDRIQSAGGRSRPPEGQGGRFPRQGQASGIPRPRPPAGDAVHAGDDRQSSIPRASHAIRSASCRCMDPETGETLVDELGRRSFTTSVAYGPTIGKNIALAYLPWAYCQEGRKLAVEYFGETYPVEVAAVGYKPLYDPENLKPRS